MHYLARLEQAIKNNWERPAVANFRSESFTFGQMAERIERLHIFFRNIGLKKGDKVAQGDIIAKVGNTGRSYGAHVHFEILYNGKTQNPLNYISK